MQTSTYINQIKDKYKILEYILSDKTINTY